MEDIINLTRMRIYHTDSDLCVVIFTGIGGTVEGYNDKYTKIAYNLKEKHNASVFIVAVESWNDFDTLFQDAMSLVEAYYKELGIEEYIVYTMGSSAGATMVLAHSYKYKTIKKVLAINPVIQIHYNKLKTGVERAETPTSIVFGSQDPSTPYSPMLERNKPNNVKIETLDGVDHQFTQHFNLFIELPEKYLFN